MFPAKQTEEVSTEQADQREDGAFHKGFAKWTRASSWAWERLHIRDEAYGNETLVKRTGPGRPTEIVTQPPPGRLSQGSRRGPTPNELNRRELGAEQKLQNLMCKGRLKESDVRKDRPRKAPGDGGGEGGGAPMRWGGEAPTSREG